MGGCISDTEGTRVGGLIVKEPVWVATFLKVIVQVDAFFGPCCVYAAAPVGRQLHYWQVPMLVSFLMLKEPVWVV